jgi:hypothetical protein
MMGRMSDLGPRATDRASLCREVLGLTESMASERIKECGYRFRIAAVGDKPLALHADRKRDRIDLWLSDERVVVRAEPS